MRRTFAPIYYVMRLEQEEYELRDKILIPSNMLDGEVRWAFMGGIDFDDKNEVEEFLSFIIDVKVNPLSIIGESFHIAKTDISDLLKERENRYITYSSEKQRRIGMALSKIMIEEKKEIVEEWMKKCQKKTRLSRDKFIEKYEPEYNNLMCEYEELIKLLKILKE